MGHDLAGRAAGARPPLASGGRAPSSPTLSAASISYSRGGNAPRGWCDTDSSDLVDARLHSYDIRQDNNNLHINLFVSKEAGE